MKRKVINITRLLSTVALITITLSFSLATAQASPPTINTEKHLIAMANWTMEDGDLYTDVYISACMQHANLWIYITQWGPGALPPIQANGEIPETALSIDKKLTTATLDGTITVYDWISEEELDVTFNIEWTSVGSKMKFSDNWHFKSEYSIESGHMRDISREAVTVGSISIIDISEPLWTFAQLSSSKQHSVMK